jgi:hypothetical protein
LDKTIDLDAHRGIAAQKATELRRLIKEVADDRERLRRRQDELERFLAAAPSTNWNEACEKIKYLLSLFAETAQGQDPRRQALIADVLDEIERLLAQAEPHA